METTSTDSGSSVETTDSASTEGAAENQETQTQAAVSLKEKFKLMVDGEEVEDEVDWNDKPALTKKLQLAHAAQKRMGEAKAAKAKAFEIINALENDPEGYFKRMGPKGREAAEKFLLEQIQDDMMSPEEKARREEKRELEALRAEKKKAKEDADKSTQSAQETKYAQEYQATIISALEKSGLPKSPEMVKRMAGIMAQNLKNGLDLTADDLAAEVKNDLLNIVKSLMGDSDGDQLVSIFGEDVANKIRKADIRKLQEKQGQVFQRSPPTGPKTPAHQEGRPLTMEEWKDQLAERVK